MIIATGRELIRFAQQSGWLPVARSSEDDLKLGDDYLLFLTPQGTIVLIRFEGEDGKVTEVKTIMCGI